MHIAYRARRMWQLNFYLEHLSTSYTQTTHSFDRTINSHDAHGPGLEQHRLDDLSS